MAEVGDESREGQAGGVTQLEFTQAMNDFRTMFPEMEAEVIECVLRSNNGAVDSTIDQLLQMSSDVEKEKVRAESPLQSTSRPQNPNLKDVVSNNQFPPRYSNTPPPSYHQAVPDVAASAAASMATNYPSGRVKNCNLNRYTERSNLAGSWGSHPTDTVDNLTTTSHKLPNNLVAARDKWNPPMLGPLPDTFLRIEQPKCRSNSSRVIDPGYMSSALLHKKMQENERLRRMSSREGDPEAAQYLEDERMAILLQNEEFVRELQHDQEFMSTLQMDAEREGTVSAAGDSDVQFKDMLRNMGKASRKKFDQLAGLFSKRKRSGFLGKGAAGDGSLVTNPNRNSRDFLIKDDEYRELDNDDTSGSERADSPFQQRRHRNNAT